MSQNSNVEQATKPIMDEVYSIYQNRVANTPEIMISPNSAKLYDYADSIIEARANLLASKTTHHEEIKNSFFKGVSKITLGRDYKPVPLTEEILKTKESAIGASIFGKTLPSVHRKFWNENHYSWYYYEATDGPRGAVNHKTVYYEVHPDKVWLMINGDVTHGVDVRDKNLEVFMQATEIYHGRVMREIYGIEPTLDKKSK